MVRLRFFQPDAELPLVTAVTDVTRVTWGTATALLVALTTGLLTIVSSPPAEAGATVESYTTPASHTFHLNGLGYGHGIGMSQFGAEGMGRLGKTYRQILNFYYPGTNFAHTSAGRQIRVSISGLMRSTPQGTGVVVLDRAGLQLHHGGSRVNLPSRIGGNRVIAYRNVRTSSGIAVWAVSKSKAVRVKSGLSGSVRWQTAAAVTKSRMSVLSAAGYRRTYRGFLDVKPGSSSVMAVNTLRLEDYLRSVVSSEVPSSWTAAALRAQAVAARSYALVAQVNARAAHRSYDICDTTSCQVYSPISAESGPEVTAVRHTSGVYLRSSGQPVFAMFSSANGGYTVSGGRSYLIAKPDPYDGVVSGSANWGHSWSTSVSASHIESSWPQIGNLQKLKVLGRDGNGQWGGRVLSVALVGSKSTVSVSADTFRWAMGLKSTWWTVTNADSGSFAPAKNVRVAKRDRSAVVRWGAPDSDRKVQAYRVTVAGTKKVYRMGPRARHVRVTNLTNGKQYRARVAPVYKSRRGPNSATPAFVPSSSYSYFQSLPVNRVVERHETAPRQHGGQVSFAAVGKGRAPVSGTRAVAVRVISSSAGKAGRVFVWPCSHDDRDQVAVTYPGSGTTTGVATVGVPANGRVCVGSTTKLRSLDVDLLGYYTGSGVGTKALRSVAARRLVNSKTGLGWSSGRLVSGKPRDVRIAGRGGVPDRARTVLLSLGLVSPTENATLSIAGRGMPVSLGAAVHAPRHGWRTGTMVARLDDQGRLPLRLTKGRADVQVDVLGWFRPQTGERAGRYRSTKGFQALSASAGALHAGDSRAVRVRGSHTGIPGAASSVVVQALARGKQAGYLTVVPAGTHKTPRPMLAFSGKGVQRTSIVVPVGDDGRIRVTAKGGGADVSFRITGWYS
jgi:SpoIID/LytB domain protein